MSNTRYAGPVRMRSHRLRSTAIGLLGLVLLGSANGLRAQDLIYQEVWRLPLASASGVSVDGQGRPWALVTGRKPAVVRLNDAGAEVERRPLEMPSYPPSKYLNQKKLSVLSDGSFLAADLRFDPTGGYLGRYEKSGYLLSRGDDVLFYASRYDRVRQVNIDDGAISGEIGRLGIGPDRLWLPGAVASDGQRVLVVDGGAIKVFQLGPAGHATFAMAIDGILTPLPANHVRRAPHNDIALDALGRLYVANGKAVSVYDSAYRPLGRARLHGAFDNAMALAVGGLDRLYVVSGAGNGAVVVGFRLAQQADGPSTAPPMPVRTAQRSRMSLEAPVSIVTPWRRGQPDTSSPTGSREQIRALAPDPTHPGVLWLGTGRGLLRWAPESGDHREWTVKDGLPAGPVTALWVNEATDYLWVASGGGLARLALKRLDEGIETIGVGEPRASSAHGFIGAAPNGGVWFWNGEGLYAVRPEDSEAVRHAWPETPSAAARAEETIYITDGLRLWALDPTSGTMTLVTTVDALFDLLVGPAGEPGQATGVPARLPHMTHLAVDAERDELWIGTHGHGVFRLNLESGAVDHPAFQKDLGPECGRSGPARPLPGRVVIIPGGRYVQLARCLGRLQEAWDPQVNELVTAGPVTSPDGQVWAAAAGKLLRIADDGAREFPLP